MEQYRFSFRRNFRVSPGNPGACKKGPVQKLVLKGSWEQRKWIDRWIELDRIAGVFRYCFKEGSHIDTIAASSVKCIRTFQDQNGGLPHSTGEVQDFFPSSSSMNEKNCPTIKSIWPSIIENSSENYNELEHGFLIQTITGEHAGREYFFRTNTQEEALYWIESIRSMIRDAQPRPRTAYSIARSTARQIFESLAFTVITTMLILLNFSAYVFDTQVVST